jgi:hypothetical protein
MAIPMTPEEAIIGMVDEPEYHTQSSDEDEALWEVNLSAETPTPNVVTDESEVNATEDMEESDEDTALPPVVERDISDSEDDSMPILEQHKANYSSSEDEDEEASVDEDPKEDHGIPSSMQFSDDQLEWSIPTFMRKHVQQPQKVPAIVPHPMKDGITLYCLKDADLMHYLETNEYLPSPGAQQHPCKHFKCCQAFGRDIPPPEEREYGRCLDEFEPALPTFNFDSSSSDEDESYDENWSNDHQAHEEDNIPEVPHEVSFGSEERSAFQSPKPTLGPTTSDHMEAPRNAPTMEPSGMEQEEPSEPPPLTCAVPEPSNLFPQVTVDEALCNILGVTYDPTSNEYMELSKETEQA